MEPASIVSIGLALGVSGAYAHLLWKSRQRVPSSAEVKNSLADSDAEHRHQQDDLTSGASHYATGAKHWHPAVIQKELPEEKRKPEADTSGIRVLTSIRKIAKTAQKAFRRFKGWRSVPSHPPDTY